MTLPYKRSGTLLGCPLHLSYQQAHRENATSIHFYDQLRNILPQQAHPIHPSDYSHILVLSVQNEINREIKLHDFVHIHTDAR